LKISYPIDYDEQSQTLLLLFIIIIILKINSTGKAMILEPQNKQR
jgi:hypothetical protein